MLVVYDNGNEVLVCTSGKDEKKMLKDYFTNGGRSLNDYDRTIIPILSIKGLAETGK